MTSQLRETTLSFMALPKLNSSNHCLNLSRSLKLVDKCKITDWWLFVVVLYKLDRVILPGNSKAMTGLLRSRLYGHHVVAMGKILYQEYKYVRAARKTLCPVSLSCLPIHRFHAVDDNPNSQASTSKLYTCLPTHMKS